MTKTTFAACAVLLLATWGCGQGSIDGDAAADAGSLPPPAARDAGNSGTTWPDAGPTALPDGGCAPTSCTAAGAECGFLSDGCGRTLECGTCAPPAVCGGAGTPNHCGIGSNHVESQTAAGATGDEAGGVIPQCCVPSAAEKADIDEVFRLLNEHRRANGVPELVYDPRLEAAIEAHAHHMATHSFMDHYAPESVTTLNSPWARAESCGVTAYGENIAAGQDTPAEVMQGWKNSAGHNQNMLERNFKSVGIGKYVGGPYGTYWGQLFGSW